MNNTVNTAEWNWSVCAAIAAAVRDGCTLRNMSATGSTMTRGIQGHAQSAMEMADGWNVPPLNNMDTRRNRRPKMTDLHWPDHDAAYYDTLAALGLNIEGSRYHGVPDTGRVTILTGQVATGTLNTRNLLPCNGYTGPLRWGVRCDGAYALAHAILYNEYDPETARVRAGAFYHQVISNMDADRPLLVTSRDVLRWMDEQEGKR